MKLSRKEWLIFGVYCNINVHTGEVILKNLKFKFNENSQKNLYRLIELLDYIDKKEYSLNAKLYNEFNKLNFSVEIAEAEKYIFKDVYITSLIIN